jgi:predicted DNA-binding transcriptional regulator AlpA
VGSRELLLRLLKDTEVAEFLGVSVATVRRWRLYGQGPPWIKCGFVVRYAPETVLKWLSDRQSLTTVHEEN